MNEWDVEGVKSDEVTLSPRMNQGAFRGSFLRDSALPACNRAALKDVEALLGTRLHLYPFHPKAPEVSVEHIVDDTFSGSKPSLSAPHVRSGYSCRCKALPLVQLPPPSCYFGTGMSELPYSTTLKGVPQCRGEDHTVPNRIRFQDLSIRARNPHDLGAKRN